MKKSVFLFGLVAVLSCIPFSCRNETASQEQENTEESQSCKANPFADIDIYALIGNNYCTGGSLEEVGENIGVWRNFNNKIPNTMGENMLINGTDIYTVVIEDNKKIIKKNGNSIYSITQSDVGGDVSWTGVPCHLFIDGNDVYYGNGSSIAADKYWHYTLFKNGTKIGTTSVVASSENHGVYGIGKINGNIVVYGTYKKDSYGNYEKMCYWINGNTMVLYDKLVNMYYGIIGGQMFIYNNSLYLIRNCGYSASTINGYCYKDGVEISKTTDSKSHYYHIYVNNGDVYISGDTEIDGKRQSAYWKNGVINVFKNFTYTDDNYYQISTTFYKISVINNKVVIGTIFNRKPFIYVDDKLYPLCIKANSCEYYFNGLQVVPK